MRYTTSQYDEAIANLQLAKTQLKPDGNHCAICGDGGHQAWECAWNPLRAMEAAKRTFDASHELHEALHNLCGYYQAPINTPALMAIVPTGEPEDHHL